jgi:hypothetical protein
VSKQAVAVFLEQRGISARQISEHLKPVTGDSIGNNSNLPPDVLWMQFSHQPLDEFFAAVRTVPIVVTAHDGKTMTTYRLTLSR